MKQNLPPNRLFILSFTIILFFAAQIVSFGETTHPSSREKYWALPLSNRENASDLKTLNRYGIPFIERTLPIRQLGATSVKLGGSQMNRIFLLGMTYSKPSPWSHPRDYSMRFFIGDELGRIRLDYADGSTQSFPLILGESIWWGKLFYENPEPFPTEARFRDALAKSLRLYPPAPVTDGNYVAVITPRQVPLQSITLEASPVKWGVPVVDGITVESLNGDEIPGAVALPNKTLPPEFEKFVHEKALLSLDEQDYSTPLRLNALRRALYTSDEDFRGHVAATAPPGYAGPEVTFKGNIFAEILANAFRYNVQDMADKVGADGMYHTSSKGSVSWGDYNGFGTYRINNGRYYHQSWSRDLGRSLQELTELGYIKQARRCADYCLHMARLWEERPSLKIHGEVIPSHWCRIINRPKKAQCFENDGHGLITMFLYKLWQRLPDREQWLHSRWPDIKAAGDWILWQFAHPKISGATNGVLHTTGESAAMNGYSVYADCVCMNALRVLAQMADSIGKTNSAEQWRYRADKMQKAISTQYIVTDPKYGRVWTMKYAGFPYKTSVLGPLIFQADYNGFAPEDGNPRWRMVNEAAYQRLIDNHLPYGFYGQAMGYGQGFMTQAALLLDRMRDATQMLNWAAKEIYDPKFGSYLVPEGCEIDPTSGHFWFRIGDLGNGVQEAEIVKALRLVIGVDDTQPNHLQFFPRMPYGWTELGVEKYPVLFARAGKMGIAHLRYQLERSGDKMKLGISCDKELGAVAMRLGPFSKRPDAPDIRVNGQIPPGTTVEHSGDSWWVRFKTVVGPASRKAGR